MIQDWPDGIKRIPLHLMGFGALGFGLKYVLKHSTPVALALSFLFLMIWRAYEEYQDVHSGGDTVRKAILDWISQSAGAVAGILIAGRIQ